MSYDLATSAIDHRRKWDKDEFERKAKERLIQERDEEKVKRKFPRFPDEGKVKRELLKAREYKVKFPFLQIFLIIILNHKF